MSKCEAKDISDFEIQQKEVNAKIEIARNSMENLKRRYEMDKNELDKKQGRMEKLRAEVKMVQDLSKTGQNEKRSDLEQHSCESGQKSETVDQLLDEYKRLQSGKLTKSILIFIIFRNYCSTRTTSPGRDCS